MLYSVAVREFKVPFGLDQQGNRVYPDPNNRRNDLVCPNPKCRGQLILSVGTHVLRDGTTRATHFRHKPETYNAIVCNPETWSHETAKDCIYKIALSWISGTGSAPQISSQSRAEDLACLLTAISRGAKPDKVHVEEYYKAVKPDVRLIFETDEINSLVVEVRATNKVPYDRARKFDQYGFYWLEVIADDIIANPLVWVDISAQLRKPNTNYMVEHNSNNVVHDMPIRGKSVIDYIIDGVKTAIPVALILAAAAGLHKLSEEDQHPWRSRRKKGR